jgi:thiamine pyrophosphate-dependent acetolactate synthase large subunit-like protein
MGVSFGFAICAAACNRDTGKRVIAVDGDSGFGFSAMELETCVRYRLPITFIVINNGGVYSGVDDDGSSVPSNPGLEVYPTQLGYKVRYDKMCQALGGLGYYVENPSELRSTLEKAISETEAKKVPSVVNIIIQASGQRKEQEHSWLTRPNSKL